MAHLFVPGPVDVDPTIAQAQTQAMLPHRSQEFETIFHRAEKNARLLFGTQYRVFITASSGTGLQEAAVRNFAHRTILSCSNGAFGDRWYDVAVSNGKETDKLEETWEYPIDPQKVREALSKKHYDILTIVHNETSTGLMNPIQEIATAVQETSPDTIICVDAVSSLSGVEFNMDQWGIDFILTSSQKALALPPGLGFGATSDRALKQAEKVENRGWYFDLVRLEKHRVRNSTPATPAISLIYALDQQLERILAEGLQNRFSRHAAMAKKVQDWALKQGFELFAAEGYRSHTVTTVKNTQNIDIADLNQFLLQRGMRIANGYGKLKNNTFRIAHMGELQLTDIEPLLKAIEDYVGNS